LKTRTLIFLLLLPAFLQSQNAVSSKWYEGKIQQQVYAVTEVLFNDVVNPPAAARFYAYTILSGFELLSAYEEKLQHLQNNIKSYPQVERTRVEQCDPQFAALYCILETGKSILPSGYRLEEKQQALVKDYASMQSNRAVIDSSIAEAKRISKIIVAYSRTDGYFTLSTKARYRPGNQAGAWAPTPPEYMGAVEPNWNSIRPFFLDSCSQFKPIPEAKYDVGKDAAFFALAREVYRSGSNLTEEQTLVANFWDCNPFAVQYAGHMSVGLKKISPGGHWLGITGIVCDQQQLPFMSTLAIHAVVACAMHDAFISCWDEKYRSNRIRPETMINKYIDEKWKPLLQTPPFPEYTSGHSVVSTTVAEILTDYLGDTTAFTDTTEMYIGLPARKFFSFRTAADEACISRLYGGIHYRDAIENGKEQGMRIAKFILGKVGAN
jgi:hypothetical protein